MSCGDDAAGDKISGGQPKKDFGVSAVDGYKATFKLPVLHGNASNSITWRVDRDHGTPAAAIAFMRDHPASFPDAFGLATGVLQDKGEDDSVRFLQNCAIVHVHCVSYDGQSTVFEYTATGGAWTDTINRV